MNAQTITEILHAKSDAALKKHINNQLNPLFMEAKDAPYSELQRNNPEEWKQFKDNPWIGEAMKRYRDLAFLYLRDNWREKAVHNFISKVEEVHQLGEDFTNNEIDAQ